MSFDNDFYRDEISDIQDSIKAQDAKIGILCVICFLPISQATNSAELITKTLQHSCFGKILIFIIGLSWFLSIGSLFFALYPRFKKKHPTLAEKETKDHNVQQLEIELNNLYDILKIKISAIKIALWAISLFCLLCLLAIIFSI
ncbi:hypothetical protein HMPREF2551_05790 [Neisseria sp. HMSC066H01]|uniref:hypothetical protein n=1 Tax=Neisseria sp. HMSC066H01 TaxID=1715031 RepID=UPI0008A88740|nr:hypothetical protein [Neisseria sp. HMSC066H01]OHQ27537.1 hypothetical protein HMPREF2551_05790 [Neisseria sp. HMSC066H01]